MADHTFAFSYDSNRDYLADPDFGFAETVLTVNADALTTKTVTDIVSFSISQPGDTDSNELYIFPSTTDSGQPMII